MIKIKSNEQLFYKYRKIGSSLTNLNVIVQNDIELSKHEVGEWLIAAEEVKKQVDGVIKETVEYIKSCNKEAT